MTAFTLSTAAASGLRADAIVVGVAKGAQGPEVGSSDKAVGSPEPQMCPLGSPDLSGARPVLIGERAARSRGPFEADREALRFRVPEVPAPHSSSE
ncbi:hypothetical protein ACWD6I_11945 [Streptomyces sp. NPDC002454]